MPSRLLLIAGVLGWLLWPMVSAQAAEPVSFRNDVMAVLSKAGCNQGTCHGNQNGKNGFKLSLRGQDPAFDLAALTRDQLNRRVDPLEPAQSLLLLKAIGQVPHGGGRRFSTKSPEYEILVRWIAEGMQPDGPQLPRLKSLAVTPAEAFLVEPADNVQIKVSATFNDGSTREVTRWALYTPSNQLVSVSEDGRVARQSYGESTVIVRYLDRQASVQLAFIPERPSFLWHEVRPQNVVDEHVFAKLRRLRMNPSDVCSDSVFLRRAYLDLLGLLPPAEVARAYINDPSSDKRARLIGALLERPEFADYWALKWSDLLRNEERTLDRKGVQNFYYWIRRNIAEHRPLDRFVYDLVASRGSTYRHPEANYYRANRDPVSRAESAAQVLLGIRLQCAKCHNHPFDRWTQGDYYSWAGLFARVDYKILENRRTDRNDSHEFDGEQIVWMNREGEVTNPTTGEPAPPRFLGTCPSNSLGEPTADRLESLAAWITEPSNPFFAKAQVNRIWYHLLGRGIVDPIDDFRATNPPINPPLLDALARELVTSGYDLRHVIRLIMNSRTYQASAVPNDSNADDEANFSHGLLRPLAAEQLLDALNQVTGTQAEFNGYPRGMRAGELPGVRAIRTRGVVGTAEEQFLQKFGKPPRLLTCECERSSDTTLGQVFQLVSGPLVNELLTEADNRLSKLLASGKGDREIVDELYWTALSRSPTFDEMQAAEKLLARTKQRRQALEDIVWGLVNAKEFVLRQ
jgi:hypothetical protein